MSCQVMHLGLVFTTAVIKSRQMALHKVFVYGTLKKGEPNHFYFTNKANGYAKFISAAETVKRYPLIIDTQYNIPFLIHKEGVGHCCNSERSVAAYTAQNVIGEVYEVDDTMLKALDGLESHPDLYSRLEDHVRILNVKEVSSEMQPVLKCWIYFILNLEKDIGSSFLSEYHSEGPHGKSYVRREKNVDYTVLKHQLHCKE
ncbi:putative gamma-glutamylcyclotransferase CG2811 isoform X1 [Schistocerca serialis cubense]|uniref:putative gamma-glutamylcyclotransferase CG2811 isoform X1 n=1 Tax=Schistocerca serialis cubense TaxID=2023355 RepID=UPI00214E2352|nr:putative gamma-glutamylcyclotransferase CG2811 isoform X1 [Schistocerca serialis cubense]